MVRRTGDPQNTPPSLILIPTTTTRKKPVWWVNVVGESTDGNKLRLSRLVGRRVCIQQREAECTLEAVQGAKTKRGAAWSAAVSKEYNTRETASRRNWTQAIPPLVRSHVRRQGVVPREQQMCAKCGVAPSCMRCLDCSHLAASYDCFLCSSCDSVLHPYAHFHRRVHTLGGFEAPLAMHEYVDVDDCGLPTTNTPSGLFQLRP